MGRRGSFFNHGWHGWGGIFNREIRGIRERGIGPGPALGCLACALAMRAACRLQIGDTAEWNSALRGRGFFYREIRGIRERGVGSGPALGCLACALTMRVACR